MIDKLKKDKQVFTYDDLCEIATRYSNYKQGDTTESILFPITGYEESDFDNFVKWWIEEVSE